ncbi:MAG: hypothetical protein H0W88_06640 [Parachlamydiaceae bacterium]|nr:hypothetical protein [Parachlamydiaceae bacterium]
MLQNISGSLKNIIEFTPRNAWNSLSPLSKLILKLATALFATLTASYFVYKRLKATSTNSTEEPSVPLEQKEQSDLNKIQQEQQQSETPSQQQVKQPIITP